MPAQKMENYINDVQLTRLVAKDSGITIKAIAEMREAQDDILKILLKRGKIVTLGNLGRLMLQDHKEKAPREFKRPYDGKVVWLDRKPPYQSPVFKFNSAFAEIIHNATRENHNGR